MEIWREELIRETIRAEITKDGVISFGKNSNKCIAIIARKTGIDGDEIKRIYRSVIRQQLDKYIPVPKKIPKKNEIFSKSIKVGGVISIPKKSPRIKKSKDTERLKLPIKSD